MDYLVSRGKMIVTLDRQGKELSVGLSGDLVSSGSKSILRYYIEYNGKIFISAIVKRHYCIMEFDPATGKGFVDTKTIGLRNDLDKGPFLQRIKFFPMVPLSGLSVRMT